MWLAALALLLLPLLAAAGAPPPPWFGPTAVWTPPWFSPAVPLQYLPDPAAPGNPPPHLIAQGMRSAVFNRLMPEGELYPGGPAHQLSDGRIFTPKWKLAGPSLTAEAGDSWVSRLWPQLGDKPKGGFVPDWSNARAYKLAPAGCGGPRHERFKGDGDKGTALACEMAAVREAVRRGLPKKLSPPGECYQYGGTTYCLPSRSLDETLPAGVGPDVDYLRSAGSLKDEAMGLIPRGPFPWQRLGLTTHELLGSGGPSGVLTAASKSAGGAAPAAAAPQPDLERAAPPPQTAHDPGWKPRDLERSGFLDKPMNLGGKRDEHGHRKKDLPPPQPWLRTSLLRGIPPFAEYRPDDRGPTAAPAPRMWCGPDGRCGVPLRKRAEVAAAVVPDRGPESWQQPAPTRKPPPRAGLGVSQQCAYGFPCAEAPTRERTPPGYELAGRWAAYLHRAGQWEAADRKKLARDELEPPDWAERSEFPELYKEPEKAPEEKAPEEAAEKAPKEDHGRDDFHPEARGKPLGGPQSLSGIGVRDYP